MQRKSNRQIVIETLAIIKKYIITCDRMVTNLKERPTIKSQ